MLIGRNNEQKTPIENDYEFFDYFFNKNSHCDNSLNLYIKWSRMNVLHYVRDHLYF